MANKLNCAMDEISTTEMDCPKAKIGTVIGKNGSMIKQIQEICQVYMEYDRPTGKVIITGSEASIERAVKEIKQLIEVKEEEIALEQGLADFLTSKYIHVVQELRDKYIGASIDVHRNGGKLCIRANPEDMTEIKGKIFGLDIVSKEYRFAGKEIYILVGKKGATIDGLCSEYLISIEVGETNINNTAAVFTGHLDKVEAAWVKVQELINDSKEVIEVVSITPILKNLLLAQGGHHIKAIQTKLIESVPDGNCFLSINKDRIVKDNPELLIKVKQSLVSEARKFACDSLKDLDKLVVKCSVDPYAIPRIIGKGGETIRKLTQGKTVFVEVDNFSNEVCYGATSVEALNDFRKEISEVIDSNSIVRIKCDPVVLKLQYEFIRSEIKNNMDGCWLDTDHDDSCYIVRGKKQDIEKVRALIEEFTLRNKCGKVLITDEDRKALLAGGRKSKIVQFSEEMGVKLLIDRAAFCLVLSGPQDKVEEATKKLNRYLNGGDGYSVAKISLNEQVVGKIIGKGGRTRQQLEQKYDGVTISISGSHIVTIRGQSEAVADCRVEIEKMIASARVTHIITVTEEQISSLKKKEYTKKIYQEMPVNLTTTEDKVVLKGTLYDVRDAVALLNEMLTGEYITSIELDASQFSKVRNTARDPSHFERMEATCGAKVELDLSVGSIMISGKRSNVKRTKDQVYAFLDFILPNEMEWLKITKPLYMSIGQASTLAKISAEANGVAMHLDRDLGLIVIRSIDEKKLKKATELMKQKIEGAKQLAHVYQLDASDSWILAVVIGRKGSNISVLRSKYPTCKIDISKESRTITVVGESQEIVQEVRVDVNAAIETARKENVFFLIPKTCIQHFMGKDRSHLKELTAKYGADIQRLRKGHYNFKISGEESEVKSTKEAIDAWLGLREKANLEPTLISEREQDVAAISGQKGIFAPSIEKDYKCKIDVNQKTLIVTVRGQHEEQQDDDVCEMKEPIEEYGDDDVARQSLVKEQKENVELAASIDDTVTTGTITTTIDDIETTDTFTNGSQNSSRRENCELDATPIKLEEGHQKTQFPTKSVGVDCKSSKNVEGKKEIDASVTEGTEAGKSLFAMLMSHD